MEIRRTTQFLKFALGTRSPANPHYFKSQRYNDPNQALLRVTGGNVPYFDPVTKQIVQPDLKAIKPKSRAKSREVSTAVATREGKRRKTFKKA